ncbi:MAG TPA: CHAT domain-containing protein [Pseudonocardiaceae bacterium]|nr:CHAT domain-containing protein [Pseudonocardiaceae bacterium]
MSQRLDEVRELYRRGLRANNAWRPAEAAKLLRRALRLLDRLTADAAVDAATLGADAVDADLADAGAAVDVEAADAVELRTRILISLAPADAEIRGADSALEYLRSAEALLGSVPDEVLRIELTAKVAGQRGLILGRASRLEESIASLSVAVAARERACAAGEPSHIGLATSLLNRGTMHTSAGHPGPAARDFRRLLRVVESGLSDGRSDRDELNLLDAKALHGLAALAWRVGDIPKALWYYEKTFARYSELIPSALPKLRMDQAEALLSAGLAEDAARQLDEALPELRRLRNHQNEAEAELLRATAALAVGDLAGVRNWASSAQRRFRRRGNQYLSSRAALIRLRATVDEALARDRVPANLAGKALALADTLARLDLIDQSGVARMLAVRLELRRGEVAEAVEHLALVPKPRRVTPVDHRMLRRLCLAELAVARGNRRQAFAQARAGLAELSRFRDRMGGVELVSGTAMHGRALGQLAIRLVIEHSRAPARQLFGWLERTRAQVYRYQPLPPPEDPVLAEKVSEYRYLSREVQQAHLAGRPSRDLAARHAALGREVMRLGWRDSPWGQPRPMAGIDEVVDALGDRAMISYLSTNDVMMALVVVAGRVRLVPLGDAREIIVAAQELHADLDALSPDTLSTLMAQAVAGSAVRRARQLDERLLRPLAALLGDRELVVIPTGALYAVAWAVLPSLRGRPLVVAPSATAWLAAHRSDRQDGATVLVGGPGLAAAVGEVNGLSKYHPAAETLNAEEATVQDVLRALDGAALAHLAAHGAHEPENALFSKLELWDGALFAHEVARLRRPPQHVVLAACELALSRIRPGDEALGFAGALLSAGGRTVTAAVTRVGDQAAAAAMADYHRQLAAGAAPATALAEAAAVDPLRRPFICLGAS